jgi:DNA polymerase-3 subunit delta'
LDDGMTLSAWQQPLYTRTVVAFRSRRLGHAQILQGEAHLGKLLLARALAKRLLCQQADDAEAACGVCRACQRFEQGSHGDFRQIGIELNEKTGKMKTAIGVDQIRDMSEWLALTAQLAGPRVVIIETAHRLNPQAANALLKTLEEPMPDRYLLLVTDQPKALPATVRSRCQRLEMACPDTVTALAWLKQNRIPEADATALLTMASGNPGLALAWAGSDGSALYQEVRADLAACIKHQTGPAAIARKWLADERADLRLLFAAQIGYGLTRTWAAQAAGGVKHPQAVERLKEWIDGINRLRLSLSQPLRHDLGLAGRMLEWRQLLQDFR